MPKNSPKNVDDADDRRRSSRLLQGLLLKCKPSRALALAYFLNPESVSIHLFCSICQDVFNNPHRAPCGHSFCKQCIDKWLQQRKTCPEDRRSLNKKDLHHDFILENIIGDQMVACKFRKQGCTHVFQLSLYSCHLRDCSFNPVNLPEFLRSDVEQKTDSFCADGSLNGSITEDSVPTPAKPSLKMRLFQAGGMSRDLLCSAFDANSTDDESKNARSLKRKHSAST